MRLGIDTLFEDPDKGSSAIDYLVRFVKEISKGSNQHKIILLVSPNNRHLFGDNPNKDIKFVNCFFSNEYVLPRIIAEQTIVPLQAKKNKLNVLFSPGNICPLVPSSWRTVLKISTLHHYLTPKALSPLRRYYRRIAFTASAKRADTIIANSFNTKKEFKRYLGIPEDKVIVVHEAVDESFRKIEKNDELRKKLQNQFGIASPYILFASALYPYKGADALIRAFADVKKKKNEIHLAIAGADPLSQREKLETLADSLGVIDDVHFLGKIPNSQMPVLFGGAEVFVYPTLSETFGKPLVEAMRCEVPIIASNVDSLPEIANKAAIFINPLDIREIASSIERVLSDKELRYDLISQGRARAKEFSWENHVEKIIGICEGLAENRR